MSFRHIYNYQLATKLTAFTDHGNSLPTLDPILSKLNPSHNLTLVLMLSFNIYIDCLSCLFPSVYG